MKSSLCVFFIVLALAAAERHAIIIAPRDNWPDYGVQSESCRMYNDLIEGGMKAENIILMSTTKLLTKEENPHQNKLFTDSDPQEIIDRAYPCSDKIDYESKDMTASVMVAIMKGDVEKLKELTGQENPRALKSTAEDDIMLYFTSHGGPGSILVGNTFLSATELEETIKYMYDNKMYKNFLFLMEACYSGSMFVKFPTGYNLYAITAADDKHSSYESHCPPNDVVEGKAMGTCLSCYWDNALEWFVEGGADHTLDEVFQHTHDKVAEDIPNQGVSHYGDVDSMGSMLVRQFLGEIPATRFRSAVKDDTLVAKPDVPAHLAKWRAIRASTSEAGAAMREYAEIKATEAKREVEVMRLGVAVMGEKAANKSYLTSGSEFEVSCVIDLQTKLMSECGHSMPFAETTMNMLKNICLPGLRAPNVDFANVCL